MYLICQSTVEDEQLTYPLIMLNTFAQDLCRILQHSYWERPHWKELKPSFVQLCESIAAYVDYLAMKNKRTKLNHRSPTPVRELGENLHIKFISAADNDSVPEVLHPINDYICGITEYTSVALLNYTPHEPVKKLRYINTLESSGLCSPCMLMIYTPGGNVGNIHFLWKVPSGRDIAEYYEKSQAEIENVKTHLPIFHTRAMHENLHV